MFLCCVYIILYVLPTGVIINNNNDAEVADADVLLRMMTADDAVGDVSNSERLYEHGDRH